VVPDLDTEEGTQYSIDIALEGYELQFSLSHQGDEVMSQVIIPSTFPRGNYQVPCLRKNRPQTLNTIVSVVSNNFSMQCCSMFACLVIRSVDCINYY